MSLRIVTAKHNMIKYLIMRGESCKIVPSWKQLALSSSFNSIHQSHSNRGLHTIFSRENQINCSHYNKIYSNVTLNQGDIHLINGILGDLYCMRTRCYQTQKKTTFEVDHDVVRDTVVFSYTNDRLYAMISIFGVMQFLFWSSLAFYAYGNLSSMEGAKGRQLFEKDSWWGKVLEFQTKYKYRIAVSCVCIAYLVLAFAWIAPQRAVQKLTLLRGGERLKVTTYTHLGRKKDFTVDLENISFVRSRQHASPQLSMKVKGKWFYFLLDTRDGKFHDTKLFDYVVALQRKL